jgi:hypothetical protein
MQRGDRFNSMETAQEAARQFVLDNGESFKLKSMTKNRSLLSVRMLDASLVFEHRNPARRWFQSMFSSCMPAVP